MNQKPRILIHTSGGIVTRVTGDIEIEWDSINWNDILDRVEIVTPKFIDKHKDLLSQDEIRILNSVCSSKEAKI